MMTRRVIAWAMVVISLILFVTMAPVHPSASAQTDPDPDTMVIRSFPSGLEVRVIPKAVSEGYMGDMYNVTDDYLVGLTPVETPVEPGDYYVLIMLPSEQAKDFWADGEVETSFYLEPDASGGVSSVTPGGKNYLVTKREGYQALVTALFWFKDQSLADFAATLPTEELFNFSDSNFYAETFLAHGIPAEDQPILQAMLTHTGKLVWHAPDDSQYLYVYFNEPDQLIVEPYVELPSDSEATDSATVEPTSASPVTSADTDPIQMQLVYSSTDPIVALGGDQAGNLYARTNVADSILKIAPDGSITTLYTGLDTCGFADLQAMTVLPGGEVVVNSCIDDKLALLKIDQNGSATPLPLSTEGDVLSLVSDAAGRIYVGVWSTEGDLSVVMSPTHFTWANYMVGQVIALDPDGTQSVIYEGGLPLSLTMAANGGLHAAIWGQSGSFAPEEKSYSVCDPRVVFWIALSDQVQIVQLIGGGAAPLTDQLQAGVSLVASGDSLLATGMLPDGECGFYGIGADQTPQRMVFAEAEVDSDVTAAAVVGGVLYFADVDGNLYGVSDGVSSLPVVSAAPELVAPAESAPTEAAPVEATPAEVANAPASEISPLAAAAQLITADNVAQVEELAVMGSGDVSSVTWPPDQTSYAAASTRGIWFFDNTGQGRLLAGHTDAVLGTTYSPDGTLLASWGRDETIRLWDAATGTEQRVLQGHTGAVYDAVFSLDGTQLASASDDETVRLWDVASGEMGQVFEGCHDRIITSVAISPDASLIASGGRDNRVCLWDVAAGSLKLTLEGHTDMVEAVAFSPDGTLLASTGYDATVRLWNVATGSLVNTLQGGSANRVAFSADGMLVAAEGRYDVAHVWDVATGAQQSETYLPSPVQGLPPAGGPILVAMVAEQPVHTLVIQDLTTGATLASLDLPFEDIGQVTDLAYSPDGALLAAGGGIPADVWDGVTGERVLALENTAFDSSRFVAFKSDGTALASASFNFGALQVWAMPSGAVLTSREGHPSDNWPTWADAAFSPDLTLLAVSRADGSIEVWNITDDTLLYTLQGHPAEIRDLEFSPDGTLLASAGEDDPVVRVWDVAAGTLRYSLEGHTRTVESVAFSPHGTVLATGSSDSIRLWNVITGAAMQTLEGESSGVPVSMTFNPDSSLLAWGQYDGTIQVWNLATNDSVITLPGHMGSVDVLAFRPDGVILASGGRDNTIRLWGIRAE